MRSVVLDRRHPRPLCLALLAFGLAGVACEPISLRLPGGGLVTVEPPGRDAGGSQVDARDAGDEDAGTDGGLPDAGPGDAGPVDAVLAWEECRDGWQWMEVGTGAANSGFILDADGVAHYAFEQNTRRLAVGTDVPGSTVSSTGWEGLARVGGMKVDAQGALHVFFDGRERSQSEGIIIIIVPGTLMTATNASGQWVVSPLGSNVLGTALDFDIDAAGVSHALYSREDMNNELFYATNATGKWEAEDLRVTAASLKARMRVDAQGHVHIAYQWDQQPILKYMTNASGQWVSQSVTGFTRGPALALDPSGVPHLAFIGADDTLRHAVPGEDGRWHSEDVAEFLRDSVPALVVDPHGGLHLLVADVDYSMRTWSKQDTWVEGPALFVPDLGGPAAGWTTYVTEKAFAVDAEGRKHLAWNQGIAIGEGPTVSHYRLARQCP